MAALSWDLSIAFELGSFSKRLEISDEASVRLVSESCLFGDDFVDEPSDEFIVVIDDCLSRLSDGLSETLKLL